MSAASINKISPETFTTSVLIGDIIKSAGGSNDSLPSLTRVNNVPVSAALEIQSTEGALLLPRMTTAERDDAKFVPTDGMMIFNLDTELVNIYQSGSWQEGSGSVIGPGVSVIGDIATFADTIGEHIADSGVNISAVPPPLLSLGIGDPLVNDIQLGGIDILSFNDVGFVYTDGDFVVGFHPNSILGKSPNTVFGFANPSSPDAIVELTEGALLLSRLTQTEINALIDIDGMMVFNEDIDQFNFRQGGAWITFSQKADSDSTFIVQTADATLPNAQSLGLLTTGLLKNNVSGVTGTLTTAVLGTDYGNVVGPGSAVSGNFASFSGTSGKIIADSGISSLTVAPSASKYILQQADAALPNAQSLGALTTGILKSTTTTGVVSIAIAGTDYGTVTSITAGSNLTGGAITTSGTIALSSTPSGLTSLGVGGLSFSSQQISGTGTNTDILIRPNGTGSVSLGSNATPVTISSSGSLGVGSLIISGHTRTGTSTNTDINITPNGTGSVVTNGGAITLTSTGLIIATTVSVTNVNSTNTNAVAFTVAASGSVPGVVNFNDASNTHFVGLTAPNSISSSYVLILPAADGTTGQALTTDGSHNLSFSTVANRAAKFIVQTSDSSLTNAQVLGSLATGLVKNTTTTGVLSIGTAGTDYYSATHPTTLYEDANHNIYLGNTSGTSPAPAGVTDNVVMGAGSGISFISGAVGNVLFGSQAGPSLTSGSQNIYIGNLAGALATTAASNVAIGNAAGSGFVGYTSCTFIGPNADASASGLTNATAIGSGAVVNTSNSMVLGSGAKVGIGLSSPLYTLHLSSSAQALKVGGGYIANYTTTALTAYTALVTDYIIKTTSTSAITITLPTATTTNRGQIYHIKDGGGNAGTNNITVTPTSGTIDGAANVKINTNFGKMQVFSDGANWFTT